MVNFSEISENSNRISDYLFQLIGSIQCLRLIIYFDPQNGPQMTQKKCFISSIKPSRANYTQFFHLCIIRHIDALTLSNGKRFVQAMCEQENVYTHRCSERISDSAWNELIGIEATHKNLLIFVRSHIKIFIFGYLAFKCYPFFRLFLGFDATIQQN